MSYANNPYGPSVDAYAAMAAADERTSFITKTYLHLAGAIALFVALEAVLLNSGIAESFVGIALGTRFGWFVVLGAFMLVSFVAEKWARSAVSPGLQYMGLGLFVVAESIIFTPLLYLAVAYDVANGTSIVSSAAYVTLGLFGAMTAAVLITKSDFSFLRTFLVFGSFAALGFIVLAILFNFQTGPIFLYAMIALSCGYILYDTSNVLHHYRIGQHVAAALALFASVALLFWYILQLFMSRRN